jgi:hypothetical protein
MFKVGGKSKSVSSGRETVPKLRISRQARLFCGVDAIAARLAVAVGGEVREGCEQREFANSGAGHRRMIAWLLKKYPLDTPLKRKENLQSNRESSVLWRDYFAESVGGGG